MGEARWVLVLRLDLGECQGLGDPAPDDAIDREPQAERGADRDREKHDGHQPGRTGQECGDQQHRRDPGSEPMAARVDHPRLRQAVDGVAGDGVRHEKNDSREVLSVH